MKTPFLMIVEVQEQAIKNTVRRSQRAGTIKNPSPLWRELDKKEKVLEQFLNASLA